MTKPLLLDTYCKAGGCTKGYQRAGFYVVGVDIEPQKNYCGDEFFQGDAIEFIERRGREFDVVHASPPCQRFSVMTKSHGDDIARSHVDLIPATRNALKKTSKPYIIENVEGARAELICPTMLCGTMFGLGLANGSQIRRHRYFECFGFWAGLTPPCQHNNVQSVLVAGHTGGKSTRDGRVFHTVGDRRVAMGIDWMTNQELVQAIPPAYTEWIGLQLRERLQI